MSATPGNATTLPGLREAKAFLIVVAFGIYPSAFIFLVPAARPAALTGAYVLVVALACFTAVAFRMMMAGTARIPINVFIGGAVFIAGGAGFDILATLVHSRDLRNETNPVARFLLDSGHSLEFVLIYAGLCQSLLTLGSIFLWGGLLSQRITIVESIRGSFQTFPEFLKAILGGANVTWKQWCVPWISRPKGDRSAKYFYYPWPLAAMLLGSAAYRWYCGIEWFGFSPVNRAVVGAGSALLGLVAYFAWAWRAVQPLAPRSVVVDSPPFAESEVVGHNTTVEASDRS
jgi:hypothetical protein